MANKKQNKKKLKHRKSKNCIIIIIRLISKVLFWLHCVKFWSATNLKSHPRKFPK